MIIVLQNVTDVIKCKPQSLLVMETVSINYLCVYFFVILLFVVLEDIKWRELNFKNQ